MELPREHIETVHIPADRRTDHKYRRGPDKPLAGGLPLGAIIASEEFASAISPGLHGSTFGGGAVISRRGA